MIRTVATNGCWVVLWNIENVPRYAALLDECVAQARAVATPGRVEVFREGFVFISAPDAVTPLHIDPEHNVLLQITGEKTTSVGALGDTALWHREIERVLLGGDRHLPVAADDEQAFRLTPGVGVYVPPFAPHWVRNGPQHCISLSVTWRTAQAYRAELVHTVNGRLRRLGIDPVPPGTHPPPGRREDRRLRHRPAGTPPGPLHRACAGGGAVPGRRREDELSLPAGGCADGYALERPDEGLFACWHRLATATAAPPFLRPGWAQIWTEAYGGTADLVVASVRRRGELVAALPMMRRGRTLRCLANAETPAMDVLATDGSARRRLLEGVLDRRHRRVEFGQLSAGQASDALLTDLAPRLHCELVARVVRRQPYVDTTGGWSDYESSRLSGDRRREIRRYARRLGELGTLRVDVHEDSDERLLSEGFRLEAAGWKARAGTAILSTRRATGFYTSVAQWAAAHGMLQLAFLRLDERPIAFCLAVRQNGTLYALKTGYDEELGRCAPGMVLLHALLRSAFDDTQLRRVELLGEDEPYKRALAHGSSEQIRVQVFHHGWTSRADRWALHAGLEARHVLRAQLPQSTRAWLWRSARRVVGSRG